MTNDNEFIKQHYSENQNYNDDLQSDNPIDDTNDKISRATEKIDELENRISEYARIKEEIKKEQEQKETNNTSKNNDDVLNHTETSELKDKYNDSVKKVNDIQGKLNDAKFVEDEARRIQEITERELNNRKNALDKAYEDLEKINKEDKAAYESQENIIKTRELDYNRCKNLLNNANSNVSEAKKERLEINAEYAKATKERRINEEELNKHNILINSGNKEDSLMEDELQFSGGQNGRVFFGGDFKNASQNMAAKTIWNAVGENTIGEMAKPFIQKGSVSSIFTSVASTVGSHDEVKKTAETLVNCSDVDILNNTLSNLQFKSSEDRIHFMDNLVNSGRLAELNADLASVGAKETCLKNALDTNDYKQAFDKERVYAGGISSQTVDLNDLSKSYNSYFANENCHIPTDLLARKDASEINAFVENMKDNNFRQKYPNMTDRDIRILQNYAKDLSYIDKPSKFKLLDRNNTSMKDYKNALQLAMRNSTHNSIRQLGRNLNDGNIKKIIKLFEFGKLDLNPEEIGLIYAAEKHSKAFDILNEHEKNKGKFKFNLKAFGLKHLKSTDFFVGFNTLTSILNVTKTVYKTSKRTGRRIGRLAGKTPLGEILCRSRINRKIKKFKKNTTTKIKNFKNTLVAVGQSGLGYAKRGLAATRKGINRCSKAAGRLGRKVYNSKIVAPVRFVNRGFHKTGSFVSSRIRKTTNSVVGKRAIIGTGKIGRKTAKIGSKVFKAPFKLIGGVANLVNKLKMLFIKKVAIPIIVALIAITLFGFVMSGLLGVTDSIIKTVAFDEVKIEEGDTDFDIVRWVNEDFAEAAYYAKINKAIENSSLVAGEDYKKIDNPKFAKYEDYNIAYFDCEGNRQLEYVSNLRDVLTLAFAYVYQDEPTTLTKQEVSDKDDDSVEKDRNKQNEDFKDEDTDIPFSALTASQYVLLKYMITQIWDVGNEVTVETDEDGNKYLKWVSNYLTAVELDDKDKVVYYDNHLPIEYEETSINSIKYKNHELNLDKPYDFIPGLYDQSVYGQNYTTEKFVAHLGDINYIEYNYGNEKQGLCKTREFVHNGNLNRSDFKNYVNLINESGHLLEVVETKLIHYMNNGSFNIDSNYSDIIPYEVKFMDKDNMGTLNAANKENVDEAASLIEAYMFGNSDSQRIGLGYVKVVNPNTSSTEYVDFFIDSVYIQKVYGSMEYFETSGESVDDDNKEESQNTIEQPMYTYYNGYRNIIWSLESKDWSEVFIPFSPMAYSSNPLSDSRLDKILKQEFNSDNYYSNYNKIYKSTKVDDRNMDFSYINDLYQFRFAISYWALKSVGNIPYYDIGNNMEEYKQELLKRAQFENKYKLFYDALNNSGKFNDNSIFSMYHYKALVNNYYDILGNSGIDVFKGIKTDYPSIKGNPGSQRPGLDNNNLIFWILESATTSPNIKDKENYYYTKSPILPLSISNDLTFQVSGKKYTFTPKDIKKGELKTGDIIITNNNRLGIYFGGSNTDNPYIVMSAARYNASTLTKATTYRDNALIIEKESMGKITYTKYISLEDIMKVCNLGNAEATNLDKILEKYIKDDTLDELKYKVKSRNTDIEKTINADKRIGNRFSYLFTTKNKADVYLKYISEYCKQSIKLTFDIAPNYGIQIQRDNLDKNHVCSTIIARVDNDSYSLNVFGDTLGKFTKAQIDAYINKMIIPGEKYSLKTINSDMEMTKYEELSFTKDTVYKVGEELFDITISLKPGYSAKCEYKKDNITITKEITKTETMSVPKGAALIVSTYKTEDKSKTICETNVEIISESKTIGTFPKKDYVMINVNKDKYGSIRCNNKVSKTGTSASFVVEKDKAYDITYTKGGYTNTLNTGTLTGNYTCTMPQTYNVTINLDNNYQASIINDVGGYIDSVKINNSQIVKVPQNSIIQVVTSRKHSNDLVTGETKYSDDKKKITGNTTLNYPLNEGKYKVIVVSIPNGSGYVKFNNTYYPIRNNYAVIPINQYKDGKEVTRVSGYIYYTPDKNKSFKNKEISATLTDMKVSVSLEKETINIKNNSSSKMENIIITDMNGKTVSTFSLNANKTKQITLPVGVYNINKKIKNSTSNKFELLFSNRTVSLTK